MFQITMKVLFFITIMFVCAELYPGLPIINSKTYWEEPTKFCGSRLTIEMSIICNGRYNEDISKYNYSIVVNELSMMVAILVINSKH